MSGRLVGPLWVVTRGEGPPLVLLHGNGEDHHVFDRALPLLASGRTLVGIDARGHGRSPRGDGPLTLERMADDVAAVLGELGLGRPKASGGPGTSGVDLVGFSDGGNVGLLLALRHPGVVGRLVVCGANLWPEGLTTVALRALRATHALQRALAWAHPRVRAAEERYRLMVEQPRIDAAALAAVDVPVLVMAGERDLVRPEHTRLIADSLPRGRMVVVGGVGHFVPQRAPAAFARAVRDFLG